MSKVRKSLSPKEQAKQLQIAYAVTFGSESGKQVLRDLLGTVNDTGKCHLLSVSHGDHRDVDTAFKEGERNVGLYILAQLKIRDINELQEYAEVD